jgi:hypothetical protein
VDKDGSRQKIKQKKKDRNKRARDAERDKGSSKDDRESKGRKQTRLLEDDIKKEAKRLHRKEVQGQEYSNSSISSVSVDDDK